MNVLKMLKIRALKRLAERGGSPPASTQKPLAAHILPALRGCATLIPAIWPLKPVMMLLLAILAVAIVAASFYADYKWRQWMAAHKREHNSETNQPR